MSFQEGGTTILLKFDIPRHEIAIVIVDDSQALLRIYEGGFEAAGLKVVAKLSSGKDVLAFFASPNSAAPQSIVLLDQMMPEMDGTETARQLKQLNPNQRIILATQEDPSKFQLDTKLFDGVIQKPFTIAEFLAIIENLSSWIQVKGSRIFREPKEIENLLRDITSDSKEKIYSVRNPKMIQSSNHSHGHVPTYLSAVSKGLKVFLVTEITQENLVYCKQLMMNRGVQLRHLDGVVSNFVIWDEKHVAETVRDTSNSYPYGYVLYSNLESKVSENQYLFEYLWNLATPAEEKIRELEVENSEEGNVTIVSGEERVMQRRIRLIGNARGYVDVCSSLSGSSTSLCPELRQALKEVYRKGGSN